MKIYDGWIGGNSGNSSVIICNDAVRQPRMDKKIQSNPYSVVTHPILGEMIEYQDTTYSSITPPTYKYVRNQVFNTKLKIVDTFNGRSTGGIVVSSNDIKCYIYLTDFMSFASIMSHSNGETFIEGKFHFAVKGSAVGLVISK